MCYSDLIFNYSLFEIKKFTFFVLKRLGPPLRGLRPLRVATLRGSLFARPRGGAAPARFASRGQPRHESGLRPPLHIARPKARVYTRHKKSPASEMLAGLSFVLFLQQVVVAAHAIEQLQDGEPDYNFDGGSRRKARQNRLYHGLVELGRRVRSTQR